MPIRFTARGPLTIPFTTLLLHYDGTNGSQSFPDSSSKNKSISVINAYALTTANKKFGTASGQNVTGAFSTDALFVNNAAGDPDFAFGAGDFTIDFWFNLSNGTAAGIFYDSRPTGTSGFYPTLYYDVTGGVLKYLTNSANQIVGTTVIGTSAWNHLAIARSGTSTKMFLNGVQEGSTYTDSNNYINGANRPAIGNDGTAGTNPFLGMMDELRVSKGIARWTANFTPPSAPYVSD